MVSQNANDDQSGVEQFDDFLEQAFDFKPPIRGDIRQAEILEIRRTEIVVDLGAKRDGIVPSQDIERLSKEILKSLKVGDIVPIYILNPNDRDGNLLVSLNLGLQGHDWDRAQTLLESEELVEAEIVGYNRGGVLVRFGRLEGFVPASHSLDFQQGFNTETQREAIENAIGQEIGLKVIEVNQGRRRLILSQREARREWRNQQKERLLSELTVGDLIKGTVTGIRDFGVFVNLGGADGLIHVSELAWHRIPHPADAVTIGEEIEVYVLELDEEKQRIALSLRRTSPDPWAIVEETYQLDQEVEGTVSNVVDFGAFIVLDDGIEGLLHISEIGDGKLTEPHSYIKRGDRILMKVVRIEPERKRIGFTQKGMGISYTSVEVEEDIEPDIETDPEPEIETPEVKTEDAEDKESDIETDPEPEIETPEVKAEDAEDKEPEAGTSEE